jgi:hypothetical protein
MTEESILAQIKQFIGSNVGETDVIIGAIRYGAHLPAMYKMADPTSHPISLLLSHFIEFLPASFFHDKRFVLLDDTVYQGKQMKRLVDQLKSRGVKEANIVSAALVVHEKSAFKPDKWDRILPEHDYILWKEMFARLVRAQLRPIDGDHPLYYFQFADLKSGEFLSLIERFGIVQAVGEEWSLSSLAYTLNVDSSILSDIVTCRGVTLPPICKLRFYWKERSGVEFLTVAPMTFLDFDFAQDAHACLKVICAAIGIGHSQFEGIRQHKILYYYISRLLSALLLVRLLEQLAPVLAKLSESVRTLDPVTVDAPVNYIMPSEYIEMYDAVRLKIDAVLGSTDRTRLPLSDAWTIPSRAAVPREPLDTHIPPKYDLVEFVTRSGDPAVYSDGRWCPSDPPPIPVTFNQLTEEFGDPLFISASLDELLDAGLLKALDYGEGFHFSRAFTAGGEYNAVRVSRLAETLRSPRISVDAVIAREESLDLWETN